MEIMLYNNSLVAATERRIRNWTIFFIAGLVLSGLTAFPLVSGLSVMERWLSDHQWDNVFSHWIHEVYLGITDTGNKYPFIAYGTDWLAFAHLVIAVAFIGPLRDPIRNIWVIEFGIIACIGIFPLALIAGAIREIPFFWRLIDCSFGLVGGMVLLYVHKQILDLKKYKTILQ